MILAEIDGQLKEFTGTGEIHLKDIMANKPHLLEGSGIKLISHPLKLEVNGLEFKVEYSNRRKRATISISYKDGTVTIKSPFEGDREQLEKLITRHWQWILVNRKSILEKIAQSDSQPSQSELPSEQNLLGLQEEQNASKGPQSPEGPDTNTVSRIPSVAGKVPNISEINDSMPLLKMEKSGVLIVVNYRNNLKRLKLAIKMPDAHIEIKAPYGTRPSKICKFVEESWPWYLANRQSAVKEQVQLGDYSEGAKLFFLGKEYTIRHMLGKNRPSVTLEDENMVITCSSGAMVASTVMDWYHTNSLKIIDELVPKWSKILGVNQPKVEQKHMANAWGKCYSVQKKIVLHPQLILHPIECFEFIIVHELCHLLEPNHSKRFYQLMDKFLPSWRITDQLMNSKYIIK